MSKKMSSVLREGSDVAAWTKTRRNGNDELPTDRAAVKIIRTSRTEESPNGASNSWSPKKQTVTKVSKLVYAPDRTPTAAVLKSIHSYRVTSCDLQNPKERKESVKVTQTPIRKPTEPSPTTNQGNDFLRKKDERQKDIKEIQEMLKGLAAEQEAINIPNPMPLPDSTPKSDPQTIVHPHTTRTTESSCQRSRTDRSLTARARSSTQDKRSTARRQSSSRSKSSSNMKTRRSESDSNVPSVKRKGYDPEKAKQFMLEQQERRRAQCKTVATQKVISKVERDEIKKRLEALRKNTLNILNKNIKKARRKSVEVEPAKQPINENLTLIELPITREMQKPKKSARPLPSPTNALQSANVDQTMSKPPLGFKKIGLLRKTEDFGELIAPVGTLSSFGMNKENIILNMTQPKPPSPQLNLEPSANAELQKPVPDLELSVPDVKLKSRATYCEKSTQFEPPVPEKPPLPYWLQPTPVQVYPYNFIMAVRKKLEAITNPIQTTTAADITETGKKSIPESSKVCPPASLSLPSGARRRLLRRPDYDELSSVNIQQIAGHKLSTASSVFTPFLNSPITSPKKSLHSATKTTDVTPPLADKSKSLSDVTSSITVNIPLSNAASDISSIHSEVVKHRPQMSSTKISQKNRTRKHDDDTTAPSSIFSSPEKRVARHTQSNEFKDEELSPLSVNNINNLNLKSKLSSQSQIEEKSDVDFEQLLHDFNKSLSQVIEVNQQLQSTLTKSPRSETPKMNIPVAQRDGKSSKSDNYSSDFEEVATSDKTLNKPSNSNEIRSVSTEKLTSSQSNHSSSTGSTVETASKPITRLKSSSIFEPVLTLSASFADKSPTHKNLSEEFLDSIEEMSKTYDVKESSSPQKPHDLNNFSKDSLELTKENISTETTRSNQDIIRDQINTTRGDNYSQSAELNTFINQPAESKLLTPDVSMAHHRILNSSIGSDIFAVFNQSELELSIVSQSSRYSETHLNYSTLGLYEQLLKTESTKTEHLTALLKIREKSILDRTRGQIALLEIQKERCKAKGLPVQISTIKKKQRAILMKMEKEREEIKRILKSSECESESHKRKQKRPKLPELTIDLSLRKSLSNSINQTKSSGIVKGFELETGNNLELILLEREKELQRRREHVEHLVKWHQRLDQEEQEVFRIEQMLFKFNHQKRLSAPLPPPKPLEHKKHNKIMEIDRSLRELQSISSRSEDETSHKQLDHDYVRSSGGKLNKLWRRLTGRSEMKFDERKKYKLSKSDLEKLYEDAKMIVLAEFEQNNDDHEMIVFADQTRVTHSSAQSLNSDKAAATHPAHEIIPSLNLDFSSGVSESDQVPSSHSLNITFTNVEDDERVASSDISRSSQVIKDDISSGNKEVDYTVNFTSSDERPSVGLVTDELLITGESSTITSSSGKVVEDNDPIEIVNLSRTPDSSEILSPTKSNVEEVQSIASYCEESIVENGLDEDNIPHVEEQHSPEIISLPSNSIVESDENNAELLSEIIQEDVSFTATSVQLSHSDNETMLEDITQPKFETTIENGKSLADELLSAETSSQSSEFNQQESPEVESGTPSELEKRLIDLDESLKGLDQIFERALSPDKINQSNDSVMSNRFEADEDKENRPLPQDTSAAKLTVKDYLLNPEASTNLMPDIINEVEMRRRQQILIESDIKQLENAVPYVLLREIPNKPPPPYVPPAHGSPMTTIFPSETRIKEITFRRTKELYEEVNTAERFTPIAKTPCILDENITNIYERIILDICKECVRDFQPTFTANSVLVGNYKMPLALYNPPDRLKCLQEFVYKQVRKLLAMDKKRPRHNSIFSIGRRKRDHVDEILIQELFEEEHKWTNFDVEESEVKASVIDEIFNDLVQDVIDDFEMAYNKQKNE